MKHAATTKAVCGRCGHYIGMIPMRKAVPSLCRSCRSGKCQRCGKRTSNNPSIARDKLPRRLCETCAVGLLFDPFFRRSAYVKVGQTFDRIVNRNASAPRKGHREVHHDSAETAGNGRIL